MDNLCSMIQLIVLLSTIWGVGHANAEGPPPTDPAWQEAVEAIVRQYLRTHPEVIAESIQVMEAKRKAEEYERGKKKISARQVELLKDKSSPTSGSPNGDITVVEFFDYRCGFCKKVAGTVTQLQKEDSSVRIVYKDFPILGELSVLAAKAALAAHGQGKHQQFHEALLASENELTKDEILTIASRVGLDIERLEIDMRSPDLQLILDRNLALGVELGISGTPGFIVGTELKPGALELRELKGLVLQARTNRAKGGKSKNRNHGALSQAISPPAISH